ncbi:serine incorporator/TMS membrane protein [Yarrowia lipolytica]|jgi:hypothetical protein|uniref:YALI0A09064p n=2 Tax=Yarrowia lipolytica TaxID=4952 RepID=Q6CHG9_YARLI|nr:YALI0A09064p [Yarrowia lipolytica CLIB122]AOW00425.1 hypothetical protein YALI1_A08787g [Yarrowia lipolytica]KAB8279918.1 serine incorporator/TMS membrane protein [Yarrowia lipolytica]KAE8168817.1 serine incorporator/TMS membrane protein [Yarrowia lipolytica]KAJ8051500.1 serine incorporator/TMS membrane protein [Yarrowia lipolytica]QNP95138.1 Membrane protein TMS1 [Yarrowia lipolytica]|eukprot:XP_499892.1 YALI0A09064p [Yarrowia lipolytica CLIB122]
MGALLSIPLAVIPSVSAIGTWAATCCGAAIGSAMCSACNKCSSSIATRVGYAVLFLVNSILSWIMLTDWAVKKLERFTLDYMKFKCLGEECTGFVAVQRMNFALGVFHLIMALLLVGVHSTKNPRSKIQNGYWGFKIAAWLALIVLCFLIPEKFFVVWGNYFAMIGSAIFILIGLVLLVDFAHSWAEQCLERIEETDSGTWKFILVGSTMSMYIASIVLTILMYVFFCTSGCSMNQAAVTINLVMLMLVTLVSVNQNVQEYNPRAGLAQAAMVAFYCTYLTMSAVSTEPDDKNCNPLVRSKGTRTASIFIGALFTFVAIAYTTTRAATRSSVIEPEPESLVDDTVYTEPSAVTMRQQAIRAAVEEGSLPESALHEQEWETFEADDEKSTTKYNYVLFHIVFLLATQWTATLLTMNVEKDDVGDFVPVGRTYFSSWVKIVSAWICYFLYTWTLIAPVWFPDRFS